MERKRRRWNSPSGINIDYAPVWEKFPLAVYDERQSLDFQVKGQSSMQYISHYESPLGAITLAADEKV